MDLKHSRVSVLMKGPVDPDPFTFFKFFTRVSLLGNKQILGARVSLPQNIVFPALTCLLYISFRLRM